MNKSGLASAISKKTGYYASDIEEIINACIDIVPQTLASGEKVTVGGLISLYPIFIPERMTRNPKTDVWGKSEAHIKVKAKISGKMLDTINKKESTEDEEDEE